jgi:hypothetical protein
MVGTGARSTGFDWHDFRPKDYLLGESIAGFALFRLLDSFPSHQSLLAASSVHNSFSTDEVIVQYYPVSDIHTGSSCTL